MSDPLRSRLTWQCRRGMRELDVLLQRWLEQDYPRATAAQREQFAQLLSCSDPQLERYLLAAELPPTPELAQLVAAIVRPRPIMSALIDGNLPSP